MRLRHEKGSRPLLIRMLRIVVLAVKGFDEDKCMLRASALTFYTLLSIVPVVAMLFAVGKGFGVEDKIEASLLEQLPGQNAAVVQTDSTGTVGTDFEPLPMPENSGTSGESDLLQAGPKSDITSSDPDVMSQEEVIKLIFQFIIFAFNILMVYFI